MAYILSISAVILVLGMWQDKTGSGHSESDLGSERFEHYPRQR